MPARRLEQVQRADGVDVEIVERPRRGEVVARLRRGVDDERRPQRLQKQVQRRAIADVGFDVTERAPLLREAALIPAGVPARPKKSARMLLSTPCTSQPSAQK